MTHVAERDLTIEQVLTMLAGAPPRLAEVTAGLTPAELTIRPAPDAWSVNDVLAHLRSCDDMWGGSISTMPGEELPTIRAINPRTWIHETDYPTARSGRRSVRTRGNAKTS